MSNEETLKTEETAQQEFRNEVENLAGKPVPTKVFGVGHEIEVEVGRDDNSQPIIRKYVLSPVSLGDVPEIMDSINKVVSAATASDVSGNELNMWDKDTIKEGVNIIYLSLKKSHKEIDRETIENEFTLSALGRAIKIAMDLNDFLSEINELNEMTEKV